MTENEKRTAAEALRAARAAIEKWWTKNELVSYVYLEPSEVEQAEADGNVVVSIPSTDWHENELIAIRGVCAVGAVAYAENLVNAKGYWEDPKDDQPLVVLLAAALPKDVHLRLGYKGTSDERLETGDAGLKRDWDDMGNTARVIEFNDHASTTKRMVLNLFDRAIKLAEDPNYHG